MTVAHLRVVAAAATAVLLCGCGSAGTDASGASVLPSSASVPASIAGANTASSPSTTESIEAPSVAITSTTTSIAAAPAATSGTTTVASLPITVSPITVSPAIVVTTTEVSNVAIPARIEPGMQGLVDQAIADLAKRLSVDAASIATVSASAVVWPDGSVGCPQPGMLYTQVTVDGALIVLSVAGASYRYHSGGPRSPFLCTKA